MKLKYTIQRERFSFWLDLEDKLKLESMAKADDLKIGYLIRKAIKKYIQENYAKTMVELTAKEYQEKLKIAEKNNKTKTKLSESQQKLLRVGVRERQKIRKQKEQKRRLNYFK